MMLSTSKVSASSYPRGYAPPGGTAGSTLQRCTWAPRHPRPWLLTVDQSPRELSYTDNFKGRGGADIFPGCCPAAQWLPPGLQDRLVGPGVALEALGAAHSGLEEEDETGLGEA